MTFSSDVADLTAHLLNFRDVGGLRATNGRRVREGVLFRSDDLGVLSATDWLDIQQRLRIASMIDFRSEFEDDQVGGIEASGEVAVHHLPILDGSMVESAYGEQLSMAIMYENIAFSSGTVLASAVSILGQRGALPGIVFCTAGKDRTGIFVALLLSAIGVERDEVVADFVRSAAVGPAVFERFAERFGPDEMPAIPPEMLEAPPGAIIAVLDCVDDRFGSAANYLVEHGTPPAVLAHLESALLV